MKKIKQKPTKFSLATLLVAFFLSLSIMILAILLTFQIITLRKEEMAPTIFAQDVLVISKNQRIRRFDLVYFTSSVGGRESTIGRVIGLAGETLYYKNDQLYVDEEHLGEDYLEAQKTNLVDNLLTPDFTLMAVTGQGKVPDRSYFVLGDNRQLAQDSRMFGYVHETQIKGKVSAKIWPLGQLERY